MDRASRRILWALTAIGVGLLVYAWPARSEDQPPVIPDNPSQSACLPYKDIRAKAAEDGYQPAAGGMEGGEQLWIVLANRSHHYVMFAIRKDKTACLVSQGDNWFSLPVGDLV